MTGFSLVPLQVFGLLGTLVAVGGMGFGLFLFVRRLIVGAEVEGVFTLFAILFTLLGVAMAGLGLVGEYVGRIYQQVRGRPRFRVRRVYGLGAGEAPSPDARRDGARPAALGMTRIAVFAYSDTGHACLKLLLDRGERIVLVATHRDAPEEKAWFPSVAELARSRGIEPVVMENPLDAQSIARVRSAAAGPRPVLLLPAPAPRRDARASRRSGPGTCTARSCRSSAAARRSTGRC